MHHVNDVVFLAQLFRPSAKDDSMHGITDSTFVSMTTFTDSIPGLMGPIWPGQKSKEWTSIQQT